MASTSATASKRTSARTPRVDDDLRTFTIPDVMDRLGIKSRSTVYALIRSGILVKTKVGGSARITAASLRSAIENGCED